MTDAPNHLFRYFRYDSVDKAHIERLLFQDEIYLGPASEFGDPFDSLARPMIDPTEDGLRKIARDAVARDTPDLDPARKAMEVSKWMKMGYQANSTLIKEVEARLLKEARSATGVYCMSTVCDDPQMWRHYAAGQTGFCLIFQRDEVFNEARPVTYSDTRPRIECTGAFGGEEIVESLLTKSLVWQHENEWRILQLPRQGGIGYRSFTPTILEGVIIGDMMPVATRKEFLALIAKRPYPVKVYRVVPVEGSYTLEVVDIEQSEMAYRP
ncbi:MAG: DUF2971 domain-containing protein [Candidatus Sericytochromatia bacterium]|nr:DUF2971 domain-containing protein [Candidatus Sericytochromatia bacterium]